MEYESTLPPFREALHTDRCSMCKQIKLVVEISADHEEFPLDIWCDDCVVQVFGIRLNQFYAYRRWLEARDEQIRRDWEFIVLAGKYHGSLERYTDQHNQMYPWNFEFPPSEPVDDEGDDSE